jgi:formyl-CoA transferase
MAQARAGLMSITGNPGGPPVKIGVPICDLVCGLYVALATMAALRVRDTTGVGQSVDVSLFEAGVSFAIWEAGRYFATGEVGQPLGSAHQSTAPYQAVRTADGWATLGAVTPKTWDALCEVLDLPALRTDERYGDAFSRQLHRDTLIPAIEEATQRHTTAELVALLDGAGIPCAPIADMAEVFTDNHLRQRDFFWDAPHPEIGPVRQIGSPLRLKDTPPVRRSAGPLLGADTADVLRESGLDAATIDQLFARGVVAGPETAAEPAGEEPAGDVVSTPPM